MRKFYNSNSRQNFVFLYNSLTNIHTSDTVSLTLVHGQLSMAWTHVHGQLSALWTIVHAIYTCPCTLVQGQLSMPLTLVHGMDRCPWYGRVSMVWKVSMLLTFVHEWKAMNCPFVLRIVYGQNCPQDFDLSVKILDHLNHFLGHCT